MGPERVTLRPVEIADLPALYEFERDEIANRVAVARPRSEEDFKRHWERIFEDKHTIARTVLSGGTIAGTANCFPLDGRRYVGYWIGRPFWRRGIATRAVELLLGEVEARPLYARIASTNAGSRRVAERCGFVPINSERSAETARFPACEETIYRLDSASRADAVDPEPPLETE